MAWVQNMEQQLDLTREARNMQRFARNFKGSSNIEFSEPIEGYITESALTEVRAN